MASDAAMTARLEELTEKLHRKSLTPKPWPGTLDPPRWIIWYDGVHYGYRCIIVNRRGNAYLSDFLNGYVELPEGHPDFGKWYDDIDVDVHGGLTFCQLSTENTFWVGFDTGHAGDEGQWPLERVKDHTIQLAKQLKEHADARQSSPEQ